MDDEALDGWLRELAREAPAVRAGPELQDRVWQCVGRQAERRAQRARVLLGLLVFAVGLGAGMGTAQGPERTQAIGYALAGGPDLSPSSLLRVTP